jgi:predicted Rossmann fold flavoprotein
MRILSDLLNEAKVDVEMRTPVRGISATEGAVEGVVLDSGVVNCDRVIVATGGSSYPKSGTTGDAWGWVKQLGHAIVPIRAALAPIYLGIDGPETRAGIAVRDCLLKARQGGKEIARWRGDLLFTHRGVSGPTVLGVSRDVAERQMLGPISLEVDILPDSSFEQTTERLVKYSTLHSKRSIATFMAELIADALVKSALDGISIDPGRSLGSLSRRERNRIVELIKGWTLGDVRSVPLEKGECVAGGVALDEVDQKSMRSKFVRGLYLCGEALDIAGPVGGYNLQAAFSTGYVAGDTAAHDAMAQGK